MGNITIEAGQLIAAFIAALGIPGALMGIVVWRLEHKITKRDKDIDDRETAQEELWLLVIQSTGAAIALGEATAKAVQRIPDAHCNGDMKAALEYATDIKHQQKDFLAKQGIHALRD